MVLDNSATLLVQPGDGVNPLIAGIDNASRSVHLVIFRCDRGEIAEAAARAVQRGVSVQALIARTNHGSEGDLRKLEARLLEAGASVSRTAGDLVRYHSKLMIVDRRELYVLAFNLTRLDIERSRSFGIVTRQRRLVEEAERLFLADTTRQRYAPGFAGFVVSPENARQQLAAFIRDAQKELSIYDPKISDPAMIHLLEERAEAGVKIRVIGRIVRDGFGLAVRNLAGMRLHARAMIRDGRHIFLGSQSLRAAELDTRREAGVIVRDEDAASRLSRTFEEDWEAGRPKEPEEGSPPNPQ